MPRFKPYEPPLKPRKYLDAGVPVAALGYYDESNVGTRDEIDDFLNTEPEDVGLRSLTVLDEDGSVVGVVYGRSNGLVAGPGTRRQLGVIADDPRREGHGFLTYRQDRHAIHPEEEPRRTPAGLAPGERRPVTFDLSVAYAGFDRSLFRKDDVLVVSSALALDLALTLTAHQERTSYSFRQWATSAPLPLDAQVLEVFKRIVPLARPSVFSGSPLDRTDFVCAATAIVYGIPLYTVKPDAYATIKNGLRVVEYGAIRNPRAAREQASAREKWEERAENAPFLHRARRARPISDFGAPATERSASSLGDLFEEYDQGKPFGPTVVARLARAHSEGEDLTRTVAHILLDDANLDHSWRLGLLTHAPDYRNAVPKDGPWGGEAPLALYQAMALTRDDDVGDQVRSLALRALGLWGRWSIDASDDILFDLESEPRDERLLEHYRAYLSMADIPDGVADAELDAVRAGASAPSRARIWELWRAKESNGSASRLEESE